MTDGKACRILVIEKDAATRKLYTDLLQLGGYETQAVATVRDLDTIIQRGNIHLIISDVQNPEGDFDPLSQRRATETHRAIPPILAVTSQALPGDRQRILDSGYADYLAKPVRISELMDRVAALAAEEPD